MVRLGESGLTLGDIDLGELDAEADTDLPKYFVRTPYVEEAVAGRASLFLGRKGSGKSGVFTQLPRLLHEADRAVEVLRVTPDQYAWSALKQYSELGLLPEQAHTNAWKFSLGVELAVAIVNGPRPDAPDAARAYDDLRKFVADNYGGGSSSLTASARSLIRGLKSINLSAFGFGVGLSKGGDAEPITPAVTGALFEKAEAVLRDRGFLIAADRLDESWDGTLDSQSLLIGLVKAAKDLNNSFGLSADDTGLRVISFLRSDIYDSLRFDDKDKHRATEELLVWTADELRTMLTLRLPDGVSADDLFEPGEMRGSIAPFNYIVKRTFLRPREIIQFVSLCIKVAGHTATEISKDHIRQAEERYSSWKVDDLRQEFSKVLPHFERLLECLRQQVHRYDAVEELSELIAEKEPDVVAELGNRRILEILFESSVIGIRVGDSGSARFRSEDSNLALPSSGAVYVHQGLYKGLNIREARRGEGAPSKNEQDEAIEGVA
jgi:hypothetical protein